MKYIFLTGLYPKEYEFFFKDNARSGSIQNAPNVFQWNVVDGLIANGAIFWVLSAPFISTYPKGYKRVSIPSFPIVYNQKVIGETVSFCDLIGLKESSICHSVEKGILSWIKNSAIQATDKFAIITYTPLSFFLTAAKRIKKKYPNAVVCSIVTDMIEDAHNFKVNQNFLKRIQIAIEKKKEHQNFQIIDKFVLLSKTMGERIPEAVEESIVVEGIAIVPDQVPQGSKNETYKSLLYTGSLHEFSGIKLLIQAFEKTDNKNYRLIICGIGSCEDYIKEEAKKDGRIVFKGNLSREEAIKEQHNATALINPRQPIEEITKYSFPSKTMEYLSSGTPMIGYRLEGIPKEYYDYFYSPNDNSIEDLAQTIDRVLSLNSDELQKKGEKAFNFIKDNKNSKVQVGRIINYIEQ